MANPAFVQAAKGSSSGFATTVATAAFGSATTSGNAVVVLIAAESGSADVTSVTDNNSATYSLLTTIQNVDSSVDIEVWITQNISAKTGLVVTAHDSSRFLLGSIIAMEISALPATGNVLDASGTTTGSGGTITATTSTATTNTNDILIMAGAISFTSGTWSAGSLGGSTGLNLTTTTGTGAGLDFGAETQVVSSTNSYSGTLSNTTTNQSYAGIIVALSNTAIIVTSSVNVSDSLTTTENISLTLVDNVGVNDSLTTTELINLFLLSILFSDTTATTETVSLLVPFLAPNVSDTSSISDTNSNFNLTSFINTSDNLTISESISFLDTDIDSASDSLSTSESLNLALTDNIGLSNTTSTTESLNFLVNPLLLSVSDPLTTTENTLVLVPNLLVNVNDSLSITENYSLFVPDINTLLVSISDSLTTTENANPFVVDYSFSLVTSDSLTTTENIGFSEPEGIVTSDSTSVTESLSLTASPGLRLADTLTITINAQVQLDLNIALQDNLSVSESLSVAQPGAGTFVAVVADSLAIGENLNLFIPTFNIKTSDALPTTEMVSVVGKTAFINVSDSISILDVASAGSIGIKLSNTLSHSESVSIHIQAHIQKHYLYKMSRNNKFIGLLPNVISEFGYAQDINTGGSQCDITVAQSADTQDQAVTPLQDELGNTLTDESGNPLLIERQPDLIGNDNDNILIRNDNDIQIYEYSDYWPNGKLMFSGYISSVQAMYGADDGDIINLTALSDGSEVNEYLIESGTNNDQTQLFQNSSDILVGPNPKSGSYNYDGQAFTVGGGVTNVSGIVVKLQGSGNNQLVTMSLYDSPNGNLLASVDQTLTTNAIADYTFTFTSTVPVTAGNKYFFAVTTDALDGINIFYQNNAIYGSGDMYNNNYSGVSGGTFSVTPVGNIVNNSDLYFKTLTTTNATEAAYTGFDPTDILKDIMLNYNNKGGRIMLDPNVSATGLGATYTFNVNSVSEGINTLLKLAPNGWYWYIDVASRVLYFQATATTAQYKFIRGRHINSLQLKSTIDNLKNVVYFSGGNPGGGNVYVKYTNTASLAAANNRVGMDRISDSNVLDTTTGLVLAKDDSNEHMSEEYQTQISIIDTTMDITLPCVGDTIGFEGYGSFVDKLVLQITRITYTPDILTITVGTLPRRVHKDIQKLKDQLIALQVQNNTASPTPF